MAQLLRFSLKAAMRRVGAATFRRGEGPTLPATSPVARQLMAEPATWAWSEIRGTETPEALATRREIGQAAQTTFGVVRTGLDGLVARVEALSPVERVEFAQLVASAFESGHLGQVLDRLLLRGQVEEALRARREVLEAEADRLEAQRNAAQARAPQEVIQARVGALLDEARAAELAGVGAPALDPATGLAAVEEGDLDEDPVDPAQAQARAELRAAVVAVPIPTAASLLALARAGGYPQADDAAGWKKARLVQELAAWLTEFPPA